jgi:hypothetical protein
MSIKLLGTAIVETNEALLSANIEKYLLDRLLVIMRLYCNLRPISVDLGTMDFKVREFYSRYGSITSPAGIRKSTVEISQPYAG